MARAAVRSPWRGYAIGLLTAQLLGACVFWDMSDWSQADLGDRTDGGDAADAPSVGPDIDATDASLDDASTRSDGEPRETPDADASPDDGRERIAFDRFERKLQGALGFAEIGGEWISNGGASNGCSVDGWVTCIPQPGLSAGARLSVVERDLELNAVFTRVSPGPPPFSGFGTSVTLRARTGAAGSYELSVRYHNTAEGEPRLQLTMVRVRDGQSVTLAQRSNAFPGGAYSPGTPIGVRWRLEGGAPTSLKASIWLVPMPANTIELEFVDEEAPIEEAGTFGLSSYLSSAAEPDPDGVQIDDLSVYRLPPDGG